MLPFRVEGLRAWPPPALTAATIALLLLVRVVQTVDETRRQPELDRLRAQVEETASAAKRSDSEAETQRLQQELFTADQEISKLMFDRAEWRWGVVAHEPLHVGTLFGHVFVHIGWGHLLVNLWFFWVAAMAVERRFRWYGFVAVFVAGALGSVLAHGWLIEGALRQEPLVGLSGTAMAFVGALVATGPTARMFWMTPIARSFGTPAWVLIPLFGAFEVVAHLQGAGAASYAHGGGLVTGLLVGALMRFVAARYKR